MPWLSVLRLERALRAELLVPGDLSEPLHAEFDHPVDPAALAQAVDAVGRLVHGTSPTRFAEEARRAGGLLHRLLVPEGLRAPLERLSNGPLLVRTNLSGVPWELLHDGRDFWGFALALGTQTVAPGVRSAERSDPRRATRPRILLVGSDPAGDLPFVTEEIERLHRDLDTIADVRCLAGPLATFASVTAALAGDFDVIHYCGHVVTTPAGATLLLANRQPLDGDTIARTLTGRPVVFLNGCTSGRTTEHGSAVASLADQVLRARAASVVATLRDVHDAHAAALAETFYALLLEHMPIGEALRRARVASRDTWPASLAFALFGNPMHVPLPSPPCDDAPSPVAAPARPAVSRRAVITAGAMVGGAVAWLVVRGRFEAAERSVAAEPSEHLVVWVQGFRNAGDGDRRDPFGTRLGDAIAARLRNLRTMTVYSSADTSDLEREGAGEVEVVKHLGATKTVAGTYRIDGGRLQTTVRVVDTGTGLAELRFSAEGSPDDVDRVVLDLAEEIAQTLRILRLMLDGEGQGGGEPTTPPDARLERGLAWLALRPAFAADDDTTIRAFLERYRLAVERGDLDAIAALYAAFPDGQRRALADYFASVRDLRVQVDVTAIDVSGDDATVTYRRTDDFAHARTGRPMHLEVQLTKRLQRAGDDWAFVPAPDHDP